MLEKIHTWVQLNDALRIMTSEEAVLQLFRQEQAKSDSNPRWRRRIWSRYSMLRKRREKKQILSGKVPA